MGNLFGGWKGISNKPYGIDTAGKTPKLSEVGSGLVLLPFFSCIGDNAMNSLGQSQSTESMSSIVIARLTLWANLT